MKSMLVVSPHPDDLELSVGLLALVAAGEGWLVRQIVMTDGRNGGLEARRFGTDDLATQRRREATMSAAFLGVVSTRFLSIEDGTLSEHTQLAVKLLHQEIIAYPPVILVAPSEYDSHPDHEASARITSLAIATDSPPVTVRYCFWGNQTCNARVYSPQLSTQRLRALRMHQSQPIDRYIEMLTRKGHLSEDRFQVEPQSDLAFQLLAPHLCRIGTAAIASSDHE